MSKKTTTAATRRLVRHFFTKAVGVTQTNSNGTNRQRVLAKCHTGEPLLLEPEDDNPADENAVRIARQTGEQMGYLRAELAEEVRDGEARGRRYTAYVSEITGGGRKHYGVNLLIVVAERDATAADVEKYAHDLGFSRQRGGERTSGGFIARFVRLVVRTIVWFVVICAVLLGVLVWLALRS